MRLCGHTEPRDAWAGLDEHYGQTALGIVFADAQPLRQADLHLSYPLRLGAMPVRAALTVRQLNGTQVLFESRFARPTSRRQMYASVDVGF